MRQLQTYRKRRKEASRRLLDVLRARGVLRARELGPMRIPRTYLRDLVSAGDIVRVARGVYSAAAHAPSEHHSLAVAASRVPMATVCLLSALRFHGLTTQTPSEVWLAIPVAARRPRVDYPRLRVIRMSGAALTKGRSTVEIEGIRVRTYNAAKTVADCFKFRNKIGLDVALEALRGFRRQHGKSDDLWRYANVCRVAKVMRPYLEAVR